MSKPVVYLKLVVTAQHYVLGTFTVNLKQIHPRGDQHGDLSIRVSSDLVDDADNPISVRLQPIGPAHATLLVWSSQFKDDESTPVDERWRVIAEEKSLDGKPIELTGTFNPFKK